MDIEWAFCLHVCMWTIPHLVPAEGRRGCESPGSYRWLWATMQSWELNSGPLQEQVLFTTQPVLHPQSPAFRTHDFWSLRNTVPSSAKKKALFQKNGLVKHLLFIASINKWSTSRGLFVSHKDAGKVSWMEPAHLLWHCRQWRDRIFLSTCWSSPSFNLCFCGFCINRVHRKKVSREGISTGIP